MHQRFFKDTYFNQKDEDKVRKCDMWLPTWHRMWTETSTSSYARKKAALSSCQGSFQRIKPVDHSYGINHVTAQCSFSQAWQQTSDWLIWGKGGVGWLKTLWPKLLTLMALPSSSYLMKQTTHYNQTHWMPPPCSTCREVRQCVSTCTGNRGSVLFHAHMVLWSQSSASWVDRQMTHCPASKLHR